MTVLSWVWYHDIDTPKYLTKPTQFSNIDMFVLLKFENKVDTVVSNMNFNSKHYYKCYIVTYVNVNKLFPLKVM